MQHQRDDTLANIGTVPTADEVGKFSTFSAGSKTFELQSDTYELPISFEVANVNVTSSSTVGSSVFKLNLDSSLSDWLNKFQYFTIKDLSLDMQCTSPLGTASGAILVAYMSDPANADVPSKPNEAKEKFGVTLSRLIIRPRDNKTLPLNVQENPMFGNWRFVKRGNAEDVAAMRQTSFGTVVAIVNTQPAQSDGANFTTWLHGTLVGKGRTIITQGATSRKVSATMSGIRDSELVEDELGWALQIKLQSLITNYDGFTNVVKDMLNEGVWPVIGSFNDFQLELELADGDEVQTITFQNPTMYVSNVDEENNAIIYLPIPSHEEIYLLNPVMSSLSTIQNVKVAIYLDEYQSAQESAGNLAPMRRRKILKKCKNKHTVIKC